MALARGEEYGSEPGFELRVPFGSGFQKGIDDCCVPFGCGPHERRLRALFTRIGIGTLGQQSLYRAEAARACRRHEHGFAAAQSRVRVGARIEQQCHDVCVGVGRGNR